MPEGIEKPQDSSSISSQGNFVKEHLGKEDPVKAVAYRTFLTAKESSEGETVRLLVKVTDNVLKYKLVPIQDIANQLNISLQEVKAASKRGELEKRLYESMDVKHHYYPEAVLAARRFNQRKIERAFRDSTSGSEDRMHLQTLGTSVNPVTKVHQPFPMKKKEVERFLKNQEEIACVNLAIDELWFTPEEAKSLKKNILNRFLESERDVTFSEFAQNVIKIDLNWEKHKEKKQQLCIK